ncbi:MAG: hypothetical protein M0021_14360 [Clostridia bacterium]|nr:hypothetical protein [Clostridia bacterium]
MLQNRVRFSHDVVGKDFYKLSQDEADLVSKALYTGHAVFWQDGVNLVNSNYPNLNAIPGDQVEPAEYSTLPVD